MKKLTIIMISMALLILVITGVILYFDSGDDKNSNIERSPSIKEEIESEVISDENVDSEHEDSQDVIIEKPGSPIDAEIPTDLSLPFDIKDVDLKNGAVNPLGVVRFDKDQKDIGHSGIDIPLKERSRVYAVADGKVVLIKSASDPWGGMGVYQLIKQTGPGTGWAFLYEHIEIAEGIKEETELKKGELVGYKIAPDGFTAHLQLSEIFNDFKYTREIQCWPDFLNSIDKAKMDNWWDEYSNSNILINSWNTNSEGGKYPFRGLLDESKYPDGPQLCYALGTDVR